MVVCTSKDILAESVLSLANIAPKEAREICQLEKKKKKKNKQKPEWNPPTPNKDFD